MVSGDVKIEPGQVWWNGKTKTMAVVYDVQGVVVKLVGFSAGMWDRWKKKRITWKNGPPSTWELRP